MFHTTISSNPLSFFVKSYKTVYGLCCSAHNSQTDHRPSSTARTFVVDSRYYIYIYHLLPTNVYLFVPNTRRVKRSRHRDRLQQSSLTENVLPVRQHRSARPIAKTRSQNNITSTLTVFILTAYDTCARSLLGSVRFGGPKRRRCRLPACQCYHDVLYTVPDRTPLNRARRERR